MKLVTPSQTLQSSSADPRWALWDPNLIGHQDISGRPVSFDSVPEDALFVPSPELILSGLSMQLHSEIRLPSRLAVLSIVASCEYEGCWQTDLCQILRLPPKSVFQHIKPLYDFDCVVKFHLPLPKAKRTSSSLSASGIVWLAQYFDMSKIPKNISQLIHTQQIKPLATKVVNLVRLQRNKIVLEKDLRAYCLSFFMPPDSPQYSCSVKTASRLYSKVRNQILQAGELTRTKAWCPQTQKFESCLADRDEASNVQRTTLPPREPEDNDEDNNVNPREVIELNLVNGTRDVPLVQQVLCLIQAAGTKGVVTPTVCHVLGYPPKPLWRILSSLEASNYISKRPERRGKFLMYRYFLADKVPPPAPVLVQVAGTKKRPPTELFSRRAASVIEWVEECRCCNIPDIAKLIARHENSPSGPDRRTILRLMHAVCDSETRVASGSLEIGTRRTQQISFFYWKDAFEDEASAGIFLRRAMAEKRSEGCRQAIRRQQEALESFTSHPKRKAIEDMNDQVSRWMDSVDKNPVTRFTADHVSFTDLEVDRNALPQRRRPVMFDQKVLIHYGYVSPIMIRVELLHRHVFSLVEQESSSTLERLSTSTILNCFPLELYLRVVGCGYQMEFLTRYLVSEESLLIKDLEESIYTTLLSGRASKRSATQCLSHLLSKLRVMGLVEPGEENTWKILKEVQLHDLTGRAPPTDLTFPKDIDLYWRELPRRVDKWIEKNSSTKKSSLPEGLPLRDAFCKKNWKGQLLLTPVLRSELEAYAKSIIARFSPEAESVSTDIVLNPQSAEVQQVASQLRIPSDVVIKFLLRYFHTSREGRAVLSGRRGVILHTTRDLKYRCHLCGSLYAQRPAIVLHYHNVHQMALPSSNELYFLPEELKRHHNTARIKDVSSLSGVAVVRPRRSARQGHRRSPAVVATPAISTADGLRREDELGLLGICIVAERLLVAEEIYRFARKYCGQVQWSYAPRALFGRLPECGPSVTHPLMQLAALLGSERYGSAEHMLSLLVSILSQDRRHVNGRFLKCLRRVDPEDLTSAVASGDVPPVLHPRVALTMVIGRSLDSGDWLERSFVQLRVLLKMIILSPTWCCGHSFASAPYLRDARCKTLLNYWNRQGWVVQTKSTSMDLSRRRYALSKTGCISLLGRTRQLALLRSALAVIEEEEDVSSELFVCDTSLETFDDQRTAADALTGPDALRLLEGLHRLHLNVEWVDGGDDEMTASPDWDGEKLDGGVETHLSRLQKDLLHVKNITVSKRASSNSAFQIFGRTVHSASRHVATAPPATLRLRIETDITEPFSLPFSFDVEKVGVPIFEPHDVVDSVAAPIPLPAPHRAKRVKLDVAAALSAYTGLSIPGWLLGSMDPVLKVLAGHVDGLRFRELQRWARESLPGVGICGCHALPPFPDPIEEGPPLTRLLTWARSGLEAVMLLLEVFQLVVRLPALDDWAFVLAHDASDYVVDVKSVVGWIQNEVDASSQSDVPDVLSESEASSLQQQFDEVASRRPATVPVRLWELGAPLQDPELLAMQEQLIRELGFPALPAGKVPCSVFLRMDGRLNQPLIEKTLTSVYCLLRSNPKLDAVEVHRRLPLLDYVEVAWILRSMTEHRVLLVSALKPDEPNDWTIRANLTVCGGQRRVYSARPLV